ncbi:hypothetical protein BJ170DRAFT_638749 [Xylariales sp. AK1849]|nr:hypothetical protein BJ170DRAFT_638749 [Xylariales sp. AK1849]
MHPARCCLFNPSRALRNVFLSSHDTTTHTMAAAATSIPYLFNPRLFSTTKPRLRSFGKPKPKDGSNPAGAKFSRFPADNAIPFKYIRISDTETNTLSEPQRTSDVLKGLDRAKYTLVMVASPPRSKPADADADAGSAGGDGEGAGGVTLDTMTTPQQPAAICRIIDKFAYAKATEEKEKAARRKELNRKELELNWAIAANDLTHRLKQLKDFLAKGKRVEVMLAKKRRGRPATAEEGNTLLERLSEAAQETSAKEVKREGSFPGVVKVVFEGGSSG